MNYVSSKYIMYHLKKKKKRRQAYSKRKDTRNSDDDRANYRGTAKGL